MIKYFTPFDDAASKISRKSWLIHWLLPDSVDTSAQKKKGVSNFIDRGIYYPLKMQKLA